MSGMPPPSALSFQVSTPNPTLSTVTLYTSRLLLLSCLSVSVATASEEDSSEHIMRLWCVCVYVVNLLAFIPGECNNRAMCVQKIISLMMFFVCCYE